MNVNIYEEDGLTPVTLGADLREVCGDDLAMLYEAQDELQRIGRYWIGGGAAPLFYLTPARSR